MDMNGGCSSAHSTRKKADLGHLGPGWWHVCPGLLSVPSLLHSSLGLRVSGGGERPGGLSHHLNRTFHGNRLFRASRSPSADSHASQQEGSHCGRREPGTGTPAQAAAPGPSQASLQVRSRARGSSTEPGAQALEEGPGAPDPSW